MVYRLQKFISNNKNRKRLKKNTMNEFVYQRTSKSDLLLNEDLKIEKEFLEEGSRDLYDIIKFCCAVKKPHFAKPEGMVKKEYSSNLDTMVYDNPVSENADHDEQTKKLLSYAQRAQIYAMTAITALNSGSGEKAVWNAVRSQKYVSHIQEMIKISSPRSDGQRPKDANIKGLAGNDLEANDLIDEFEKLIQIHDSYGAFRRLAAKKLGVPAMKVTIKEINEITKQVHKAYEFNPKRRRTDKI